MELRSESSFHLMGKKKASWGAELVLKGQEGKLRGAQVLSGFPCCGTSLTQKSFTSGLPD
jgi:hypothetical protein